VILSLSLDSRLTNYPHQTHQTRIQMTGKISATLMLSSHFPYKTSPPDCALPVRVKPADSAFNFYRTPVSASSFQKTERASARFYIVSLNPPFSAHLCLCVGSGICVSPQGCSTDHYLLGRRWPSSFQTLFTPPRASAIRPGLRFFGGQMRPIPLLFPFHSCYDPSGVRGVHPWQRRY